MVRMLLLPDRNLQYSRQNIPLRAKGEDMTPVARLALLFILHNVLPRSHLSDAPMNILGLVHFLLAR
ncbi:hypothetical protein A2U01_0076192, partial [Trifolium medium]|nr:hypothetical protein [Trifolium medium]